MYFVNFFYVSHKRNWNSSFGHYARDGMSTSNLSQKMSLKETKAFQDVNLDNNDFQSSVDYFK